MEIHQLEILRELGALGSVKAVADTLMVTPSAVSQQLALLQRSVEVPLTRKEGRNLVLTDAGQVLADAGAAVVSAMADARAAIGSYHGSSGGRVTVSGFHSAGQAVFATLARILEGPGQPQLELSDEDVAQQDFPALTARYDLVLAHRMDHSPGWPTERVTVVPLLHEPLDVALPAAHPLADKAAVTADDVGGEAWVTSHAGYSPSDVLSAVAAVSSREPTIVHRINDYSTVAALVAAGGVIGLLPRYTAGPVLHPDIVLRPLKGISTRRRIDLLARPENLKRRSVMTVCEALQDIMAGLVKQG
ncbi:DNA-binding transcriptional regulator, LysR family [Pseudarthrobacter equi]|uniref:DNA-binding transcriptional regulator, LysR family n=1 Tax=Pseudarthrobacter equi TaxID=728066 RepID=A0A1H1XJT1_9MICC|nr:LysR family transcriptional regulator [Pseudarthrobacter equi]SDT09341.1 DNA-binding transcriptional regulator, LysR family [Pseudarthrobacter equi]